MESLARNTINYIRQDENYLAKKLYKGILEAAHQQVDPSIKETEFSDVRKEDNAEKIIDNLITIYESKLNNIVLQNDNFLRYIGTSSTFLLDIEQLKLIRETSTYNTILVSWNTLVTLLNDMKKLSTSYQNIKLKLQDLKQIIIEFLEISLEFFNNLAELDKKKNAQTNPLLVQLMKLYSISNLIKNQILIEKYIKITFFDIGIEYENIKNNPLININSRNRLNIAERLFRGEKGLVSPLVLPTTIRIAPPIKKEIKAESSKGSEYDEMIQKLNELNKDKEKILLEKQTKRKDKRRDAKLETIEKSIQEIEKKIKESKEEDIPILPKPAKKKLIKKDRNFNPFMVLQTEEDNLIDEMGSAIQP